MGASSAQESWEIPEVAADSNFVDGVASRDVKLQQNDANKVRQEEQDGGVGDEVWVRLYLPDSALNSSTKLPILVHVHGGGFVRFSAATSSYHHFCKKVAADATVLVVSLNHRLAPASRLPAAYHDLVTALDWLQAQALLSQEQEQEQEQDTLSDALSGKGVLVDRDPWLSSYADFSNLIFMGGSSGGNIVHNTLLMLLQPSSSCSSKFPSLKFVAQILLQPFFGGAQRTSSEIRLSQGPILTLPMSDQLWSLALPEGASREHPFCDPLAVSKLPCNLPRALVLVGGRDLLHDRQVEYAALLDTGGVDVKLVEFPDATHGFVTPDGTVSYIFMPEVLHFIRSSVTAASTAAAAAPAAAAPSFSAEL